MKREKRVRIIEVKHARELTKKLRALAGRVSGHRTLRQISDGIKFGQDRAFREAARMIDALPRVRKRMGRVSR